MLIAGLLAVPFLCAPARAVIKNIVPLRSVIAGEQMIFMAKVDKIDPSRPAIVFTAGEALKGKISFGRMPVNMTGDAEAKREKHTEKILKRLAPELNVVMFVSKRGPRYLAFVFSNGTWFQMEGRGDKPEEVKWSFLHGEPYLRRTFKGGTEELKKIVQDGLANKPSPAPDEKAEPGFGPEVEQNPKSKETKPPQGMPIYSGPVFGVAPTFLLIGPLALLATLFPTVFGGLALIMKRWMVALSACCTLSTIYFLHAWFFGRLEGTWFGPVSVLWLTMGVFSALCAVWSARRYRKAIEAGDTETFTPRRWDRIVLGLLSVIGLAIAALGIVNKKSLFLSPWLDVVAFSVPVWAATIAVLSIRSSDSKTGISVETVFMWGLVFACVSVAALEFGRSQTKWATSVTVAETSDRAPRPAGKLWEWKAPADGKIYPTPFIADGKVYLAAVQGAGLSSNGAVFCLDAATGSFVWNFDNDQSMKMVFCSPVVADGRVFIGEGFHEDHDCRMFCLDARDGKKLWEFPTTSHTESTPNVVDGRVYFGAGDDGIYCVSASDGKKIWNYPGVHVDTRPVVAGGRLYVGSGVGDIHKTTLLLCLDAATGKEIWKTPVDLPAFAPPALADGQVFFGIGNGNVSASDDNPRGALLCVDAAAGNRIWQCDARDTILGQPAVDSERVYFTSRDGNCYAASRANGRVRWKKSLGGPIVAGPALVSTENHPGTVSSLYVAGTDGKLECLNADSGKAYWSMDLHSLTSVPNVAVNAAPAVQVLREGDVERRRIFVGVELSNELSHIARWYCFEDEVK
jgi:outer membrane protein assembly factor BamB